MKVFTTQVLVVILGLASVASAFSDLDFQDGPADMSFMRGIDVLPGGDCTGRTALFKPGSPPQLLMVTKHKEGDPAQTSDHVNGKFYGRQKIRVHGRPMATNKGNCCWKYFSKTVFRGIGFLVDLDKQSRSLPFNPRSVKIVKCPTRP